MSELSVGMLTVLSVLSVCMLFYLLVYRLIRSVILPLQDTIEKLVDLMCKQCDMTVSLSSRVEVHDRLFQQIATQNQSMVRVMRKVVGADSDPEVKASLSDSDPGRLLKKTEVHLL